MELPERDSKKSRRGTQDLHPPGAPHMSQDRKPSLFASMFGSKKKTEEELEAEQQSRQKLEDRIREVLTVIETPNLDHA
jgi:hypothetical protein